jgi:predicted nucleic acid-binding protein
VAACAVYDANVLYPASVRDLLIRVAVAGLVAGRWTERILDEMVEALLHNHHSLQREKLERTRQLMCAAVPDCLVHDYEHLIDDLVLPDPDDRHVLAAAIHCRADVIVTANLADFPADVLGSYGIRAQHPDAFLLELVEAVPEIIADILTEQAAALANPPQTATELLDRLERHGLVRTSTALRDEGLSS